ncbi:peptide ABC transporter substrate-binding protein [Arthrobacter sp. MYb227]|uniref:ABC transporter substrate-binding protein n=1 Tax=Arthrobacter sp. MYb227 TaxID=1848601 RepID=UPI000CFADA51|nr:ABC transporter substrate-binding protein [Arthrobacter sp. MYb227]PQZ94799.1 peptide ABC transporter substrate-binding protein [Arthrobacter sp. MYb227]
MKKHNFALSLALAGALALTACGGSSTAAPGDPATTSESAGAVKGGTVRVLLNADYSHLDPAMGFDGGVNNFYRLVYRTLTTNSTEAGKTSEMVPDLATDLGTPSDGGKTWTFTLKDDVFFENGDPITSAEVKFGVLRSWDPATGIGSPWAKQLLDDGSGYKGPYEQPDVDYKAIETPDAKTIVFHLNQPFADFSSVVGQNSFVPFPVGSGAGSAFDSKPIASGPYKVDSYQRGAKLNLSRNDKWSSATDPVRPSLPDNYEFLFGLDGATIDERMLAVQGDDANAISGGALQAANISRVQDPKTRERAVVADATCTTYMSLNTTKAPFDDVKVRQAINYAIDKSSLLTAAGGSLLATPANTVMVPTLLGWNDFNIYPSTDNKGDIEKAKALLAEAGQSDGFELVLDTRAQPKMQAFSQSVQQSLAKVGIDVKLNVIDTSSYYEVIGTRSQQNDAAITGWCPDWASGQTFLPPLFDGKNIFDKGNSNLAQLNDAGVNKRIAEIAAMEDATEANKAYGELDEQIMELAPVVPMLYENGLQLTGPNIGSSQVGFNGGIDLITLGLTDPAK